MQNMNVRDLVFKLYKCAEEEGFVNMEELIQAIHENSKEKGWWDEERDFPVLIALFHSELSEALEEYRNKRPNIWYACNMGTGGICLPDCVSFDDPSCVWRGKKPEGIAIELADCIIRIFDYCAGHGIDIMQAILVKHEFNKTRDYKHGGKVC